jgi:glucosamine-6-phosphate deaminase
MSGLTLTPTAMLPCTSIDLMVTGEKKAEAVARVVEGDELPETCPARLLAEHPDVTLCLDEPAAKLLD